mgnify:CR=1 FL=1
MIRINVISKNKKLKKITIRGHAEYADYGKDIVCAAVSATYICTVNAILKLNENSIKINSKDNLQEIIVVKNEQVTQTLLDNMISCLLSLTKQYPKNIDLVKEEK